MGAVADLFVPKKPKPPPPVEKEEPPPVPTVTDAEQQADLERNRRRRRRGAAASILTGETGLDGALGPVSRASAGAKAMLGPGVG